MKRVLNPVLYDKTFEVDDCFFGIFDKKFHFHNHRMLAQGDIYSFGLPEVIVDLWLWLFFSFAKVDHITLPKNILDRLLSVGRDVIDIDSCRMYGVSLSADSSDEWIIRGSGKIYMGRVVDNYLLYGGGCKKPPRVYEIRQ